MTPFPVTLLESSVISAAAGSTSSILIAIAYMMVSNSLIANIIMERRRNVKHQMIISGVSIPAYWLSHYIVDLAFQAIPSVMIIFGVWAFNLDVRFQFNL
jgi:ATP-binding cassette, subfamily A (ABC1), member 3